MHSWVVVVLLAAAVVEVEVLLFGESREIRVLRPVRSVVELAGKIGRRKLGNVEAAV